jgi:hypothetical protein
METSIEWGGGVRVDRTSSIVLTQLKGKRVSVVGGGRGAEEQDSPGAVKIGDENGGLLDRLGRTGAHIDI